MSPDVAASVRARLLRRAKESGEEFELVLVRFAVERFLYRLGASDRRDRCVLKGAVLLTLWMNDPYRATRDIDLLATGPDSDTTVREIVTTACAVPCPEDGLAFDVSSLDVTSIREAELYHGQRAVFLAYLGKARIRVQVDVAFGDVIASGPEESELPTMLDTLPAPRVRTYPRNQVAAEKFEAMVKLGRRNSRMKDFHDLWALSSAFAFDGASLRDAVHACFKRRGTAWTEEVPDVLTPAFYEDPGLEVLWAQYLRSNAVRTPPPGRFEQVGERIRQFLAPVRDRIISSSAGRETWPPGGPWRPDNASTREEGP